MIQMLYSAQVADKNVYIWDIARDSAEILLQLAFRMIEVKGFVSEEMSYWGQKLLNRLIISPKILKQDSNAILIIPDDFSRDEKEKAVEQFAGKLECRYFSDLLVINPTLYSKRNYFYGVGGGARALYNQFRKEKMTVDGFCVTTLEECEDIYWLENYQVVPYKELKIDKDMALIITVESENVRRDILEYIEDEGCECDVYIKEFTPSSMWAVSIVQMLDVATKNDERIFLCCKNGVHREMMLRILDMYDIDIAMHVYLEEDRDNNIEDIYTLAMEDTNKCALIITEPGRNRMLQLIDIAESIGFSLEKQNYASIYMYTYNREIIMGYLKNKVDRLVMQSMDYTHDRGTVGWRIYGEKSSRAVKICIVGGSTSSEIFRPENWITKLYRKIRTSGCKVLIYNGGHTGNTVTFEFLRLLRDGYAIHPDIVISMSGVNDTAGYYWGKETDCDNTELSNNENDYEFWCRIQMEMKAYVSLYHAKYYGFLQPMNLYMEEMSVEERCKSVMLRRIQGAKSMYINSTNGEQYINLLNLFHHTTDMFFDAAHYTDTGNERIAEIVYHTIIPELTLLSSKEK